MESFEAIDVDDNGEVSYEEFRCVLVRLRPDLKDRPRIIHEIFDRTHEGAGHNAGRKGWGKGEKNRQSGKGGTREGVGSSVDVDNPLNGLLVGDTMASTTSGMSTKTLSSRDVDGKDGKDSNDGNGGKRQDTATATPLTTLDSPYTFTTTDANTTSAVANGAVASSASALPPHDLDTLIPEEFLHLCDALLLCRDTSDKRWLVRTEFDVPQWYVRNTGARTVLDPTSVYSTESLHTGSLRHSSCKENHTSTFHPPSPLLKNKGHSPQLRYVTVF